MVTHLYIKTKFTSSTSLSIKGTINYKITPLNFLQALNEFSIMLIIFLTAEAEGKKQIFTLKGKMIITIIKKKLKDFLTFISLVKKLYLTTI